MLDPHLAKVAALLVEAFLAFLTNYAPDYHEIAGRALSTDIIPLPRAISKILYSLCKIRGHKVITQFLSARPQQLEPMLAAFESWNHAAVDQRSNSDRPDRGMVWEERYIMILWMSHLSQVPFDLASLASRFSKTPLRIRGPLTELPDGCPQIVVRLIAVSSCYLGAASREREAAVKLLVRLALREDLQKLGIHHKLLSWAFRELESRNNLARAGTDFTFLGLLSFLANFVSSASTLVVNDLVNEIQRVALQIGPLQSISTTVAKLMVKLHRGLALHCTSSLSVQTDAVEIAINFLMDQLATGDTGVRFAASKALAKIASKLDQDLAMQILETVLEDLKYSVSLGSSFGEETLFEPGTYPRGHFRNKTGNFQDVDALQWHGLILTVSHFIFQRSIPASELFYPIKTLIEALNFSQKNALGSSVGANVRDAACFGLWALAKKYSTADISGASSLRIFIFQVLANELVVAALLDPAGNIRRAAAAALQEMVGRHPDTIECGKDLALMQLIDYHAVASRKNAMDTVSVNVMAISEQYWEWLLHGLLSWRGTRFEDTESRRKSAAETRECAAKTTSFFAIILPDRMTHLRTICVLRYEIQKLTASQVSDRHGLLWVRTFSFFFFVLVANNAVHRLSRRARGAWHPLSPARAVLIGLTLRESSSKSAC